MENYEGKAGHFETSIFGNDFMTPTVAFNSVYSGASTAYIESMEFFKVKEPKTKMEETLLWGSNAGCALIEDGLKCENIPHACKRNGDMCSNDYFSVGRCDLGKEYNSHILKGCYFFYEITDCRFENKLGSRCVESINKEETYVAKCYETECIQSEDETQKVIIKLSKGLNYTCTEGLANKRI